MTEQGGFNRIFFPLLQSLLMILNSVYPTTLSICDLTDFLFTDGVTKNVGGASFTTEIVVIVIMALILLTGISVIIGLKYKKKSQKVTAPKPEEKPVPESDMVPERLKERKVKHSEPTTTAGDAARDETTPAEDKTKDARRKRKKRRPIGGVKDKLPVEAGYE